MDHGMIPTMAGGFVKVPFPSPQGPEGAPLLAVRQYAVEVPGKLQLNEKRLRHASCLAAAGFVFSLLTAALCPCRQHGPDAAGRVPERAP